MALPVVPTTQKSVQNNLHVHVWNKDTYMILSVVPASLTKPTYKVKDASCGPKGVRT